MKPPNPKNREPCPECKSRGRHRNECSRKRQGGPRSLMVEHVLDRLKTLDDDKFALLVRGIITETAERKRRIEHEAASKLRLLDEILPRIGNVTPLPPATRNAVPTARISEAKRPPNACPAICPDNVEIGCFQPKGHEGDHHNPIVKRSWPKR